MPRRAASTATVVRDIEVAINSKYGAGAIRRASDPRFEIRRIPSGVLAIDWLLGGGVALDRHTEIYGSANVGKTNFTYRLIGNAQSLGYTCAFIDVEGSFDPRFAAHAGVDLDQLRMPEHVHANRVVDMVETMLRSRQYGVIVLDSIASLLPKAELESDMEASSFGTEQARLMSKALRKLTTANESTAMVYLNQTREAVGSMFARSAKPGGRAMGFYAGTQLEFVKTETLKGTRRVINPTNGEAVKKPVAIGHRILVRAEKDKTGGTTPQETVSCVFDYRTKAFDEIEDLIYLGRVLGLVKKSNNTWWVDDYRDESVVGRPKFKKWLSRNRAVAEELAERIQASSSEEANTVAADDEED